MRSIRVPIFSTGSKFQTVSNFMELRTLTLAAIPMPSWFPYPTQGERLSGVYSTNFVVSSPDPTLSREETVW